MEVRAKKIIVSIVAFMMIFLTGCWDKVEINDRAFAFAIAADVNKKDQKSDADSNLDTLGKNMKTIFTMPIPSKISGGGKAFVNLNGTGGNVPEAMQDVAKRLNRVLFLGQTKVFLFGEGLLNDEDSLRQTVDFLERDPEINRTLKVTMVKGNIDNVTNINPKIDKLLATYLAGIFENGGQVTNITSVDLNEFLSSLRNDNRAVMPCVEIKGSAAEVKDMALIKDYKLLQVLDNKYVRGYLCITNKLKNGRKSLQYKDKNVTFFISSSNCDIKLTDKNNLSYKASVTIEGNLENYYSGNMITKDDVSEFEKELTKSFKDELSSTTGYFQTNVGADYLKFGDYTKKYHYDVYKKYEKNWDEVFKNANIDYDVKVYIRRIGTSR